MPKKPKRNGDVDLIRSIGECLQTDPQTISRMLTQSFHSAPVPCLCCSPDTRHPVNDFDPDLTLSASPKDWWPSMSFGSVPSPDAFRRGTELLVSAYCVPLVHSRFREDIMKKREMVFACTKFNSIAAQRERLTTMLEKSSLKSLMIVHMEAPCCTQLALIASQARSAAGRPGSMTTVTIGLDGSILDVANMKASRKRVRISGSASRGFFV